MPGKTPTGEDMTLVSVADCDRLPTLKQMAARLSEEVDACNNAQNLDRLCARLQSVLAEVAELEVVEGVAAGRPDRGASECASCGPGQGPRHVRVRGLSAVGLMRTGHRPDAESAVVRSSRQPSETPSPEQDRVLHQFLLAKKVP
jgi:hypothetical protein